MNLEQLLEYLGGKSDFSNNVTTWKSIPAQAPKYAPFPPSVPEKIKSVFEVGDSNGDIRKGRKNVPDPPNRSGSIRRSCGKVQKCVFKVGESNGDIRKVRKNVPDPPNRSGSIRRSIP
jgi:hypothetical protein